MWLSFIELRFNHLFINELRSFDLSLTLRSVVSSKTFLILSRLFGHTSPAQGEEHYPSYLSHTVLEHYSGGWPVPRAPSSSQRQLTYTHYRICKPRVFLPSFLPFLLSSNNQTAAICDLGPVKDTDWELLTARDFRPCDPRSRSRAHDIGLRLLLLPFKVPKFYF